MPGGTLLSSIQVSPLAPSSLLSPWSSSPTTLGYSSRNRIFWSQSLLPSSTHIWNSNRSRTATRRASLSPSATTSLAKEKDKNLNQSKEIERDANLVLGIDVGGTTIKSAVVDVSQGIFVSEKYIINTPSPATTEACANALLQVAQHFKWNGAVGVGVPSVVRRGRTYTAANIHSSWVEADVEYLFNSLFGHPVTVVNDADAAAYAEVKFGAGRGSEARGDGGECEGAEEERGKMEKSEEKRREKDVIFMVTFGTGVGTAMFVGETLIPNLELGHLELYGEECEKITAGVLVEKLGLSWDQWAERVTAYLTYLERLFWPDVFIVGGGVSFAHEKWLHLVRLPHRTPIKVAEMKNDAGIVGAAMAAHINASSPLSASSPSPS